MDTSGCVAYDDGLGMVVGKARTEKDQKRYEKAAPHTATNRFESVGLVGPPTNQPARLRLLSVTLNRRNTVTITET